MEYDTLCDTCIHRYNGCYLYQFFIEPLQADGVELAVKDCKKYSDTWEEDAEL